jgi:hypothetical protein
MPAKKLTDTQLVLLSTAAQHPEGAIELASDLKGGSVTALSDTKTEEKVVGKLLADGLIEEIPASGALPGWRRDDHAGPLGLRITPHGLATIGVEPGVAEREGEKPQETQDEGDLAPKRSSRKKLGLNMVSEKTGKERSIASLQGKPRRSARARRRAKQRDPGGSPIDRSRRDRGRGQPCPFARPRRALHPMAHGIAVAPWATPGV